MANPLVPALLDTGVTLAIASGQSAAVPFYLAITRLGRPRLSRITLLAVLSSCPADADRARALRYVATSHVEDVTDAIARRAVDLLTTTPLPTPLTADDAIVAATAIELALPLYTLDPPRFAAVPGLTTIQPY